ncbi:hypothetical protein SCALM49S_06436 [Streptomyces californicus]
MGRSIAAELLENGHEVLLIDKAPTAISVERVPMAEWLLADACEITSLDEAALQRCNVVIAATGDDKVNLVVSLLAKTEYGVPRVVARVNNPKNEWLFNESWGVDVAVSTPRLMSALVEEAVSVGDLVRLLRFSHGDANLVELTLPPESDAYGGGRGLALLLGLLLGLHLGEDVDGRRRLREEDPGQVDGEQERRDLQRDEHPAELGGVGPPVEREEDRALGQQDEAPRVAGLGVRLLPAAFRVRQDRFSLKTGPRISPISGPRRRRWRCRRPRGPG